MPDPGAIQDADPVGPLRCDIDAVKARVDGEGDRLGEPRRTLRLGESLVT